MAIFLSQLYGGPADGDVINRDGDRYYVPLPEPILPMPSAAAEVPPSWPRRHVYELRLALRPDRSAYWRYEYRGVE